MGIFEKVAEAVIEGDKDRIPVVVNEALAQKVAPADIIQKGLSVGLKVVGEKFENMELYLPEMMLAADAMKAGIDLLKPYIKGDQIKREGIFVLGTIQGDVHDIGKNIVGTFLEVSGFEVHDLGCDVPVQAFIDRAEQTKADIIGISALLTSTMTYMPDVVAELSRRGLRNKYLVMVGGAPLSTEWAKQIGADGFGKDFLQAVNMAKQLMRDRKGGK